MLYRNGVDKILKGVIVNKGQKAKLEEGSYLIPEVADFPKNRWQVFKEKYFPCFLKRLIPVKYKRVNLRENLLEIAIEKSHWISLKDTTK